MDSLSSPDASPFSSDAAAAPAVRNVGPLAEHTMETRVTYRDTDQMGMVYYANYFVYFEMGRTDLLRSMGRTYRSCEEDGIYLPVLEAHCQYLASARYDDVLLITARVTRWTRAALDFEYEVRRKDGGELLVRGATKHAFMNADGRIIRAGERILNP